MSSVKELGLFVDRRRCVECGKYCRVELYTDNPDYLKSACCGAGLRFAKEDSG